MKISVKNRAAIGQRSVRLVALTLCLITALPFTPFARQKSGQAYAIKGAQIVTVSGQVISSGNIIFRNGLITAVGANANIPADARVIDGSGLTVYPGLIDAFTNLGLPEPQNQQQAGGGRGANQQAQIVAALTGQQQGDPLQGKRPELMVTDELKPGGTAIENERNIGVTTALAVPRDGIFSGQSAVIDLNGDSVQQMVVKSPVGMHLTFNTVRGFGGGYPGSLMGVIAYMRQKFYDAQHYQLELATYERNKRGVRRPDTDNSLAALQPVIKRDEPVIFSADSEKQIRRAINIADEFNLKMIVAGGTQAQNVTDLLKEKKIPVLVSLNFPKSRAGAEESDDTETLRDLRDRAAAPKNPAALAKAGVKFAFYSGGLANPSDMFTAVNQAIENGLSKEDALRAMTLSPAEILGVSDQIGSIETGKIANLVITNGDIFARGTQVRYLFIDGEPVDVKRAETPQRQGGNRPGGQGAGRQGGQSEGQQGLNVSGQWNLSVAAPTGAIDVVAIIRQDGENISGNTTSPLGEAQISGGKISGNQVTFAVNVTAGADSFTATFKGIVEGNTIKGTVDTPQGAMDFTGTRQRPPSN